MKNKDYNLPFRNGKKAEDLTTLTGQVSSLNTSLADIATLKPSGSDDTTAMQNALNKKGKIILGKGTFRITGDLIISDDTILIGNQSKLDMSIDVNSWVANLKITGSRIRVTGLEINTGRIAIGAGTYSDIEIDNNYIHDYVGAIGLYDVSKVTNLFIHHNRIYNQRPISNTLIWSRQGHAGIALVNDNLEVTNCEISYNEIMYTNTYGISFGTLKNNNFKNIKVLRNKIYYTGVTQPLTNSDFQGSCGIYGTHVRNVDLLENEIKYCNENGIEGSFNNVRGNIIEESGWDRHYRPISVGVGSVSIYGNSQVIADNILKNAAGQTNSGSINYFQESDVVDMVIKNNIIINDYKPWTPSTTYKVDEQVLIGTYVYKCITTGTSGASAFTHSATANISDGTCIWIYAKAKGICGVSINGINNVYYEHNTFSNFDIGISSTPLQSQGFLNNSYINVTTPHNETTVINTMREGFQKVSMDLDFVRGDSHPFTQNTGNITFTPTTDVDGTYLRLKATATDQTPLFYFKSNKTSRKGYYLVEVYGRSNSDNNEIIFSTDVGWGQRPKFSNTFGYMRTIVQLTADNTAYAMFHLLNVNDTIDIKSIRVIQYEF
jgi:hypothetical protein